MVGRVNSNGDVTLQVPQTNRKIELKPGQSVDLGSGIVEEPFARRSPRRSLKLNRRPPRALQASRCPPNPWRRARKPAAAGTPEQKVLETPPESALERLRRTRPEGTGNNAPDRR